MFKKTSVSFLVFFFLVVFAIVCLLSLFRLKLFNSYELVFVFISKEIHFNKKKVHKTLKSFDAESLFILLFFVKKEIYRIERKPNKMFIEVK